MDKYSYISNADGSYIDQLYSDYKKDPTSVDITWQKFFEGFEFSQLKFNKNTDSHQSKGTSLKEIQVRDLIHAYRTRGHLKAGTNPVRERRNHAAHLGIEHLGLSETDFDTEFEVGKTIGIGKLSLRKILYALQYIYTGTVGFEYMYIRDPNLLKWFQEYIEDGSLNFKMSIDEKKQVLKKLNEAVVFENFLHTKYIGQKRFSLEGGENTIVFLDKVIRQAAKSGVQEVVIGMAHRGRLNVLANIMGKTYEQIFTEFEGNVLPDQTMGDGDVKYHMGYSAELNVDGNPIYLKLSANPSHLEAVNPVVLGYARAQIDDEYKGDNKKCIPVLIHGDAAAAGQGIMYEIAQMHTLDGYTTGGTIHFVINNQIGFTTDYDEARSSIYCTDIAKITDSPVIHVNGDDPEAVVFGAQLAIEFRQKFAKDIFIDLLCYRRHGHNESDEPKFTQPKLYSLIAKHPNPREIYTKRLIDNGDVDAELAKKMDEQFRYTLQDRLNLVKQTPLPYTPQKIEEEWTQMSPAEPQDFDKSPESAINADMLQEIAKALTSLPKGFKVIKQIDKLIKERKVNFFEKKILNWADAELVAYGSLLLEGKIVRISGQDVRRGTFSHRHSYFFSAESNTPYCQLNNIRKTQPKKLKIYNSLLSEFGVLGFEYGYAMATPQALVVWEAQFGDFANGAQVIIDQFITSAETKWQRMNGLVMLLPHGYEGQGPEHSNARPERFLQQCADYNMIMANITKPSNFFHLLRRQLAWNFRKPCVVMSPKSLLRHHEVVSPLEEFTKGSFCEVYGDDYADPKAVKRVILCSGKVYYDLLHKQQENKRKDVAIIRLEQLFPWPQKQLEKELKKYKTPKIVWAQEEPENMGCWAYVLRVYKDNIDVLSSRKASSSPATGYAKMHRKEQAEIVKKAFEL